MKNEAFCKWWDKPLTDVTEHEQEKCEKNGLFCTECPNLSERICENE